MTLGQAVRAAEATLAAARVATPRLDARLLVQHALGLARDRLLVDAAAPLGPAERHRVAALVERRAGREPVSRILGHREFWSLDFVLTPATLDPRPDSESVVEAALARVADRQAPLQLLDLGTGAGCLLLALLSELPNATGTGVDISAEAVLTARTNAVRLGLAPRARFLAGDWAAALAGRFDLVVANPPYIPREEIGRLQPEVRRFDPRMALDGGPDGLDAFRTIVAQLAPLLRPGGHAALEVGAGQSDAVARLLGEVGLRVAGCATDLAGIERCVLACAPGAQLAGPIDARDEKQTQKKGWIGAA